jgi:hypothetical protein
VLNLTNDLLPEYNLTAKSLPVMVIMKQGTSGPRNGTCWGFVCEAAARSGQVVGGAASAQQLRSGGRLVVLIRGTASAYESRLGGLPARIGCQQHCKVAVMMHIVCDHGGSKQCTCMGCLLPLLASALCCVQHCHTTSTNH